MLRRTKVDKNDELGLPPRHVITRRTYFDDEENDFYRALFSGLLVPVVLLLSAHLFLCAEATTKFQAFVNAGTVLKNYAHIFQLLMRMRQAVNHPWFVTASELSDEKDICGICHEEAEDAIASGCKHVFCREEVKLYLASSVTDSTPCPVCYKPLTIDLGQPAIDST